MIKLKNILLEGSIEKAVEDFIKTTIKGTEWENKIFIAGGYVRDELLGKDSKDIDLVANAKDGGILFSEWITKKLGIYKENSNPLVYPKYGTAKFNFRGIFHNNIDLSNYDIEVVMPRSEKYEFGNRKPSVMNADLEADAFRRDLSINSLFKNISNGEILDLTGKGIEDIKNKVARTPLDPDITFKDDPLRMMRLIRQSIKYNWKIPYKLLKAVKDNAHMIQYISAERIRDEIDKILVTDNPDKGIKLMQITGLNKFILPEFEKIVKQAQNKFHAWSTDKHTYEVLKNTPPKLIIRLAALFHDLGKGNNRTGDSHDTYKFIGHEMESEKIIKDAMKRLKYPNEIIDAVCISVKNHMRVKQFGQKGELVSDKALRKLQNDLGQHLEDTLELIRSDNISHGPEGWEHNLPHQVSGIQNRLSSLGDFKGKLNMPINGDDVIRLANEIEPGEIDKKENRQLIGKIINAVKDEFLGNPELTKKEAENIIEFEYMKLRGLNK